MAVTDLIVIGAGAAGLATALTAADAGMQVVLLEKQPQTGGSSRICGGLLAFAGTDLVEDQPWQALADGAAKSRGHQGRSE